MALLLSDGAWTHVSNPRAIYFNGDILTGSVSSTGAIRVTRHFGTTNAVQTSNIQASPGENNHHGASLLALHPSGTNGGKILAAYSGHIGNGYARVGRVVNGVASFEPQGAALLTDGTYVSLAQMNDSSYTVYYFCRRENDASTRPQRFFTSTNGGGSWSAGTDFFTVTNQRPYSVIKQTAANRVDFLVSTAHPTEANASIYHFYFTVDGSGTRSWFKSDGTQIGTGDSELPLTTADVTLVYDGSSVTSWPWDFALVGSTYYALYVTTANTYQDHTFYRATLSGGSWSSESITTGGAATDDSVVAAEASFSAGIVIDPANAAVVYLGKKYADGNIRLEQWTKSGAWAKTADVSGDTSSVNMSPVVVKDAPTTQILYLSGGYNSFTDYSTGIASYPLLTVSSYSAVAKPTSPAWQAGSAPTGCKEFLALTESAGSTFVNVCPDGGNDGTLVGTLTRTSGSYGNELSGWTTSDYVTIDPASQILAPASYPFWAAALVKNSSASEGWVFLQGSGSSNSPMIGITSNSGGTSGLLNGFYRDDADTTVGGTAAGQPLNDGNYHLLMIVAWSSTDRRIYVDGVEVGTGSGTLGATTAPLLTLGVARRASNSGPYTGAISLFAAGNAGAPDPGLFADDWLSGTFAAITELGGIAPLPLLGGGLINGGLIGKGLVR